MPTYQINNDASGTTQNKPQDTTQGTPQVATQDKVQSTSQMTTKPLTRIQQPLMFTIPEVDISKIQGHLCTEGKSFKLIRENFPNLSGAYYRTTPNGEEDWQTISKYVAPSDIFGQTKYRTAADGSTQVLIFYNYDEINRTGDLIFDPALNVFYVEIKLRFAKYKVYDKAGNDLAYDHDKMQENPDQYSFEMQTVIADDIQFLKDKETKVNQILNHKGYYITPSRCNRAGGCSCKIPIVLKAKYELTTVASDGTIRLFENIQRANSANFAMSEKHKVRHTTYKNGVKNTTEEEWEIDTTVAFAHETGHLFGFPDEYFASGGSVHKMYIDPKNKLVDVKKPEPQDDWKRYGAINLMSANGVTFLPQIPAYYYNEFKKKFENATGIEMEIKC